VGFVDAWKETSTVKRALYRIEEVKEILGCSKDHVYDLLRDGKLRAHNPSGKPGTRGTKILAASVDGYLKSGAIPAEKWNE
jgi:excisionase family DNA binding protein